MISDPLLCDPMRWRIARSHDTFLRPDAFRRVSTVACGAREGVLDAGRWRRLVQLELQLGLPLGLQLGDAGREGPGGEEGCGPVWRQGQAHEQDGFAQEEADGTEGRRKEGCAEQASRAHHWAGHQGQEGQEGQEGQQEGHAGQGTRRSSSPDCRAAETAERDDALEARRQGRLWEGASEQDPGPAKRGRAPHAA